MPAGAPYRFCWCPRVAVVEEKNASRVLVGWSIGERKLLEIVFRGARARPQHDEGVWHRALISWSKGMTSAWYTAGRRWVSVSTN